MWLNLLIDSVIMIYKMGIEQANKMQQDEKRDE